MIYIDLPNKPIGKPINCLAGQRSDANITQWWMMSIWCWSISGKQYGFSKNETVLNYTNTKLICIESLIPKYCNNNQSRELKYRTYRRKSFVAELLCEFLWRKFLKVFHKIIFLKFMSLKLQSTPMIRSHACDGGDLKVSKLPPSLPWMIFISHHSGETKKCISSFDLANKNRSDRSTGHALGRFLSRWVTYLV